MVFPVVGGNESKGYEISNSLRINAGDSAYLSRTQTAGNQRTFTASVWVKRSRLNDRQAIFSASADGSNECFIWFDTDDELFVKENTSNSTDFEIRTNRKFRDPSAWYHIVVAYDTTNSTSGDRVRIYVNGVEETSFANETQPDQNFQTKFNKNSQALDIGRMNYGQEYFGGYLTEIHWVDGSQLAPTSFGEFDNNGVWIPKKYTGSYGTNGYFLQFKQTGTSQNSSGIGADTSGEDNHFAVTNLAATDITEDTCTNNFATLNSILADGQFNSDQLSEGNTFYNEGQGNNGAGQPTATFAFNSGKWYWEVPVPSQQNSRAIGFCRMDRVGIDQPPQLHGNGFTATNSVVGIDLTDDTIDQVDNAGSHTQHVGSLTGMSDNDIFGVAVNLDDGNFQFYRNGSTYGSSYSLSNLSEWQEHGAVPCASGKSYQAYRFNFGNPAFSISSGNSDGKYGNFEYAPPSGYYALCTKRLAEFG